MSMNIQSLLQKLSRYRNTNPDDFDSEDFAETMDMAVRVIVALYGQNETMADVLHSIQTAMKLLGRQREEM